MIQYCFTRHYTFRYAFSSKVVVCTLYRFHKGLWEVEGFSYSGDWLTTTKPEYSFWMYLDSNSGIPENPKLSNHDSLLPGIYVARKQAVYNIKSSHPGSLDIKLWNF